MECGFESRRPHHRTGCRAPGDDGLRAPRRSWCGGRQHDPIRPSPTGSTRLPLTESDTPHRVLRDALAQGLVRFDANGQIEQGLAERWIVIDEGGSFIFRLREAKWNDGTPVTAEQVVPILRRLVSPRSGNPLAPS